jgi:hypothetical protein
MFYKVIEYFGPESGDLWSKFTTWRGLNLTKFDSVDSLIRPDLFRPETDEDWKNCVPELHKNSLITNIDYAYRIFKQMQIRSEIIGVDIELNAGYSPRNNLLGYDIIDGYCEISLLTNWGDDPSREFSPHIEENGLILNLETALEIRNFLKEKYPDDSHAECCEVWAIYSV